MELTPLLKQYKEIKSKYKDELLFFRMGDFYELFYEDAEIASKELGIVLTSKSFGKNIRAPLAGVPVKAAEGYIKELLKKGYRIAICEQVEEGKDIMKREVVEVLTPGTITIPSLLSPDKNIYLLCIYPEDKKIGVSYVDITTGELSVGVIDKEKFEDFLSSLSPSEVIVPENFELKDFPLGFYDPYLYNIQNAEDRVKNFFKVYNIKGFGLEKDEGLIALSHLLDYLEIKKKGGLYSLRIKKLNFEDFLIFDSITARNLEIVERLHPEEGKTLFEVINFTKTSMGARLLRKSLLFPLKDKERIEERLDGVEELLEKKFLRKGIKEILSEIVDFERVISRISRKRSPPQEIRKLGENFLLLGNLKDLLSEAESEILKKIENSITNFEELSSFILSYIKENPSSPGEGNCIEKGVCRELDELREIRNSSSYKIKELEEKERERTGIPNLRIKYNQVFGYFIEITKSYLDRVPSDYVRKQTLTQSERFITQELKELETKILSADERIKEIEEYYYNKLCDKVSEHSEEILNTAENIALLDMLLSFAEAASNYRYSKPVIREDKYLLLKDSRHPVVEHMVEEFVPNDVELNEEKFFWIITGPNMGGKSTFLRQVALSIVMAQAGSFVPAEHAEIGIVDRIFTRIGASDDLARGISTFFAEMIEVAQILNTATEKSVVLLDEIGRGTSTYDGISIAFAVSEYIVKKIRARTLFATHFHELTSLAENYPEIKNMYTFVKEWKGEVIFLRKVVEGSMDRSYGVYVAKLAGVPLDVVERAKELLSKLEKNRKPLKFQKKQLEIFEPKDELKKFIESINPEEISPKEALEILYKLKKLSNK